MKTIINIVIKEFQQFRRDPKMFGIILIAPIVQLLILGYAATLEVKVVHTAIFDQDRSSASRELIRDFESSGFFKIDYYEDNYQDVTELIDNGEVLLALVIPSDFEEKINSREPVKVQALLNGSDGNTAGIAAGYAAHIVSDYSMYVLADMRQKSGQGFMPVGSITPEARVWYNPQMESQNFMVPALLGLLLSIITLILTSLAIVKEKEIGTLEQLIVTPITSAQLILGKLIPFVLLSFVSVLLIIGAMYVIFGIAVQGSIALLFFTSFLYILSTLGFGMFVSTISKTQQQAMMISIFGIMMPMVFLSGFAFPLENMPAIIQSISYVVPLRYYITILRGIILKGTGMAELWMESAALLVLGSSVLLFSAMRFSKRLD